MDAVTLLYPWWLIQTVRVATTSNNSLATTVKILDVIATGGGDGGDWKLWGKQISNFSLSLQRIAFVFQVRRQENPLPKTLF
jgi:hypothetical protein